MEEIGLQPLSGGPAAMQALIDAERSIWVPLIKDLGISLDFSHHSSFCRNGLRYIGRDRLG